MVDDPHPWEEPIQVCRNHVLERDEDALLGTREPSQQGRDLDPGEVQAAGIRIRNLDREVQ